MPNELQIIEPRKHDLGNFAVGRVLPYAKRRMVGPFIFFDEMGPAAFEPGQAINVRPHPHIGLATITYMLSGEIRHRDSLGFVQDIRPGDVNLMTAGNGIVHSERTSPEIVKSGQYVHGLQTWIALPGETEEIDAAFEHHPSSALPEISDAGLSMRLIVGKAFGERSPARIHSPIFYLAVNAKAGTSLTLPSEYSERACYIVSGALTINGERFNGSRMICFPAGMEPNIKAEEDTVLFLLGGEPVGARHIWWNLVSTSKDRIEVAKKDWLEAIAKNFEGTHFKMPPDETEYIPLPDA